MQQSETLAIVLKSALFQERHRMVTALTELHGKITAVAKNSVQSKRFGSSLDLFCAGDWHLTSKAHSELFHLKEATLREAFAGLRENFDSLALASVLNEIASRVAPQGEPCPDLFRLHSNALMAVSQMANAITHLPHLKITLLNTYLAKVLQWSGCQPQFERCVGCLRPLEDFLPETSLSFDPENATWTCPTCRTHAKNFLNQQILVDFQTMLNTPIRKAAQGMHASLEQQVLLFHSLEFLYIYHVPGFDRSPMKSLRFLGLKSKLQPLEGNPQ